MGGNADFIQQRDLLICKQIDKSAPNANKRLQLSSLWSPSCIIPTHKTTQGWNIYVNSLHKGFVKFYCPIFTTQSNPCCPLADWNIISTYKNWTSYHLMQYEFHVLNIFSLFFFLSTERDDREDMQLNEATWTKEFTFCRYLSLMRNHRL